MARQGDVNERMRAILVDWLVDVHLKFKLMPETLHLTLSLIDRFLAVKQVTRRHLQLVGVTAMLVAAKYEEIWAPEVRDFVYISDRAYTRDQILQMEKIMLNALRFHLAVPTPHCFLSRCLRASGDADDREAVALANYLVELSLPDYESLRFPASLVAAAAVHAARATLGRRDAAPDALVAHSGHSRARIEACARHLAALQRKAPTATLVAVYRKYSSERLGAVAQLQPAPELLADDQEARDAEREADAQ